MKINYTHRLTFVCLGMLTIGTLTGATLQNGNNDPFNSSVGANSNPFRNPDPFDSGGDAPFAGSDNPFSTAQEPDEQSSASAQQPKPLPSEAENNQRSYNILNRAYDLPPVEGVPLREFIQMLSAHYHLPTYIDERAFEDEGIDPDAEVSWRLTGVRLRTVLTMVLDSTDLTYITKDGILIITTSIEAEDKQITRVYDCRGLNEPQLSLSRNDDKKMFPSMGTATKDVIPVIQSCVDPLSWEDNGGPTGAKIVAFGAKLIIRNTESVHHDVHLLLEELAR